MIIDGKKLCPTCETHKEVVDFAFRQRSKDGLFWQCRECAKAYQAEIYQRTKTKVKARVKKWRQRNPEKIRILNKAYAARYPEKIREKARRQSKTKRARRREKILEAYGNICACCGETESRFLALDHIFSDGKQHRADTPDVYLWVIQNNFPKDRFQLLCHNCNLAKAFYGECPHATKHREILELQILAVA